jgi:hypothetical protein
LRAATNSQLTVYGRVDWVGLIALDLWFLGEVDRDGEVVCKREREERENVRRG